MMAMMDAQAPRDKNPFPFYPYPTQCSSVLLQVGKESLTGQSAHDSSHPTSCSLFFFSWTPSSLVQNGAL